MRRGRTLRDIVWWVLRIVNLSLLFAIAGSAGLLVGTSSGIAVLMPRARDLGDIQPGLQSRVLSSDGELLYAVATEHREFVQLEKIPRALKEAVIAVEDREFYAHVGIDPRAILRAAKADLLAGRAVQGGSTITQQLARNVYLTRTRTLARKLAEAVLALQLERAYTKPEILELYLNQIYFGEGAYGVQLAAKTYFGRDVWDLDLTECALLAGLPKRPEYYSPFKDEQRAIERRNLVVSLMAEEGYVKPDEAEKARRADLKLAEDRRPLGVTNFRAPYFTNYVMREIVGRYGPDALYKGGLTIHTTLNLEVQEAAEEAVAWGIERAEKWGFNVDQIALAAVDVRTGAVKAMVGGVDYTESQFNRAVQGGRQAGSAFKPFVYTAAFEQGYTPDSIVEDSPVTYPAEPGKEWSPKNYDREFHGEVTFREALAKSYNVATVKVADMIGITCVRDTAERMGIFHQMEPYLPLAIGSCDVTPLEMASAYAVFATRGVRADPFVIRKIEDAEGRTLEERTVQTWRALNRGVAEDMVDVLTEVVRSGTGAAQSYLLRKFPVAGKTGTSSKYIDAWFVGFTDELSVAVWMGNTEVKSTSNRWGKGVSGATLPAPVWARFIRKAHPIVTAARLEEPPLHVIEVDPTEQGSLEAPEPPGQPPAGTEPEPSAQEEEARPKRVTKQICPVSGLLAGPYCPEVVPVTYDIESGAEPPEETCNIHTAPPEVEGKPRPPEESAAPERSSELVTLPICAITGKIATARCPIVKNQTFRVEDAPTETCDRHARH